jgi:hypothetical protein
MCVYLGVRAEEIVRVLPGEGGVRAEDGVGGEVVLGEGEVGGVRRGAGEGAGGAGGVGKRGEDSAEGEQGGGEEGEVHRVFWVGEGARRCDLDVRVRGCGWMWSRWGGID